MNAENPYSLLNSSDKKSKKRNKKNTQTQNNTQAQKNNSQQQKNPDSKSPESEKLRESKKNGEQKAQLHPDMKISELLELKNLTMSELLNLIDVNDYYFKIRSTSKREKWLLNVNAYFDLPLEGQQERMKIKLATYHDVQPLYYYKREKEDNYIVRRYIVTGTKLKQELRKESQYLLQYWAIFECQPAGEYKIPALDSEPLDHWAHFRHCWKGNEKIKYDAVDEIRKEKKDYVNFCVRNEEREMFQANYHCRKEAKREIDIEQAVNWISKLSTEYKDLLNAVAAVEPLVFDQFMRRMKEILQSKNIQVKRLDAFVI